MKWTLIIMMSLLLTSDVSDVCAQSSNDGYELVFSDEFNLPNGSQPDTVKWQRHQRNNSTWARWISSNRRTVFIKNGCLVCRAIPNKYEHNDTARFLTGAISTLKTFNFTYGKVEVRMKTNLRKGNFPAAWLQGMQKKRPDLYKEIDIVESFGGPRTFHSAFAHLTVKKHRTDGPKYIFKEEIDVSKWHVYSVVWTETDIRWFIDGKQVGVYAKSSDESLLADGQWPYDYPMYVILNQSISDDIWKGKQKWNHSFETRFDWIRVYQKKR